MTYHFKKGCRINADPQIAGIVCEELAANGNLTGKALVDASRDPEAPLHGAFNWDDHEAAELYREDQGRLIIRSLVTVLEEEETPVRAFFNIETRSAEYLPVRTILTDSDCMDRLYETAVRELKAFQQKYSQIKKLAAVFAAINELEG